MKLVNKLKEKVGLLDLLTQKEINDLLEAVDPNRYNENVNNAIDLSSEVTRVVESSRAMIVKIIQRIGDKVDSLNLSDEESTIVFNQTLSALGARLATGDSTYYQRIKRNK